MNEKQYKPLDIISATHNFVDTYLKDYLTYNKLLTTEDIESSLDDLNYKDFQNLLRLMTTSSVSIKEAGSDTPKNISLDDLMVIINESGVAGINCNFVSITDKTMETMEELLEENKEDLQMMIDKAKAEISKTKKFNHEKWNEIENELKTKFKIKFEAEKLCDLKNKGEYTELKVQQFISFFEKSLGL